ncbi:hypothetical protein [Sporosarcina limicola]|uniref:Uncharacterized protein n=1 Tax=Sporosarcina limicola TaxID=34101 RepID=A0A927MIY5_9BACL|nr:hypothetical protein [Sporosarcina limicola]MBE1554788.1 hypothetical protein [Sporosarcina limicola]
MFKTSIQGAICYEVKNYRYVAAGRNMAEFELLMFENGQIGTQGEILATKESFSPGKVYEDIDVAVQEMIDIIEEKVKDDDWVKKTQQYSF